MTQGLTPISPLDVAWLFVESDATPMHVGCLQIFEPPADAPTGYAGALYEDMLRQDRCAPPFSLRMHRNGLALPSWEDVSRVDIEYHLQRWAIPPPGGDADLHELIARLHGQALDLSRPLWEYHLIEGLAGGRIALYVKLHHSIMDGIGGMRLLQNMLSPEPQARTLAPWSAEGRLGKLQVLGRQRQQGHRKLAGRLRDIVEQLRGLPGATESLGALAWAGLHGRRSTLQAPYTAPRCVLNERVSRERGYATALLPLAELRAVARHASVSINDVLLAVCAGALRESLSARDELPASSLIAGLPVSVRPEGDTHVGTAVSFVIASLGTDLADPRDRLGHIHESTRAAKAHLAGLSPAAQTEYTLLMMAPYMTELLTGLAGRIAPAFNVIISNVPGPQKPLYFNGARLSAMYPLSIVTHGQALNITALGYGEQLHLGLSCCRQRVPQVADLARGIERELENFRAWRREG